MVQTVDALQVSVDVQASNDSYKLIPVEEHLKKNRYMRNGHVNQPGALENNKGVKVLDDSTLHNFFVPQLAR